MKIPNHEKIVSKLKKESTVMANQCTCSNCNCRGSNLMTNLIQKYKNKLVTNN